MPLGAAQGGTLISSMYEPVPAGIAWPAPRVCSQAIEGGQIVPNSSILLSECMSKKYISVAFWLKCMVDARNYCKCKGGLLQSSYFWDC